MPPITSPDRLRTVRGFHGHLMAKKLKPLDKSLTSALEGNYQAPIAIPPGRKVVHHHVRYTQMPDVREQIIRIYNEADPIGFLNDVVNGKMIETHDVVEKDGMMEVVTTYVQPTIKQRIDVAKYLAEKYMPKMAVVNHRHMHSLNQDSKENPGQRNFAQIVNAASRVVDGGDVD